jgi:long-chain acyl-CoA synthetase
MSTPWDQPLGVWNIGSDHADLPAIADAPGGIRLTFGELVASAHRIANALQAAGIGQGSIVGMAFPNGAEVVRWQLACEEIGVRYVMLNPALSPGEVRAIMAHASASGIVVDAAYADRAAELDSTGDLVRVSVRGSIGGFVDEGDFLEGFPDTAPADRTVGGPVVYTSGTTGRPKAIWRPLPNMDPTALADAMKTFCHAFRFQPLTGAHLVSAGMYHGGCQSFYRAALNAGQALVIMERFDPQRALDLIDEHRVTTAYMVPTQFVRFLGLPEDVRAAFDGSSLEVIVHSAAPCPLAVKQKMMDWWGPIIWETYGGTEGPATIAKPYRWLDKPGTVGRAIRGTTVRILDDDGKELPANTIGNIYIDNGRRSFSYLDDDEATEAVYRGPAFTIGDAGYLDRDGYLFVSDRVKDMIITGGTNVYPAEVEALLVSHPAVADVAVIGVPDGEWGESVKAIVQPVPSREASPELAEELMAYCFDRLAHFKCPRSIEFRTSLPRTDAGKLLKRQIRDEYWETSGRGV